MVAKTAENVRCRRAKGSDVDSPALVHKYKGFFQSVHVC